MTQPDVDALLRLAVEHHQAGRRAAAEALYRQVLGMDAAQPDALHLLGVLAYQGRHHAAAVGLIRQAIALRPQWPEACIHLGNALREQGKLNEALAAYDQALFQRPQFADAYFNKGIAAAAQGNLPLALQCYEQTLALRPGDADAYNNLGNVLKAQGKLSDALEAYQRALTLRPQSAEILTSLGNALKAQGQLQEAINTYDAALKYDPNFADAHWNVSLSLLMSGQFQRGWEEYEWRWKSKDFPSPIRNFPQPLWNGQDITDKTIMLHGEQGYGDTVHFARYIPLVAQRARKVIIECQPELIALFKNMPGVAEIYERFAPLPPFDFHAPFLSLPRAFKTTLETIPQNIPYLTPLPEKVEHFRELLVKALGQKATNKDHWKIGIVWAGSPTHKDDQNRSMQLTALAPWFKIPGISFISLQVGTPVNQIMSSGLPVTDFTEHLKDFSDTAALIANVDMVLSVDTSVVHVTGALGKPVWVMVTKVPDWRWLTDRSDSPWYPTMRIFRREVDDWTATIDQVAAALAEEFGRPPLSDKINS